MAIVDTECMNEYIKKVKDDVIKAIEKDDLELALKAVELEKHYSFENIIDSCGDLREALFNGLRKGNCSILLKYPHFIADQDMQTSLDGIITELYGEKALNLAKLYGHFQFIFGYECAASRK